jgi:two-component system, NtrC family, sensor histidine kinase HydH
MTPADERAAVPLDDSRLHGHGASSGGGRHPATTRFLSGMLPWVRSRQAGGPPATEGQIPRHFNLLRWFSVASLGLLVPVAVVTGVVLSRFVAEEALQHDGAVTAEFIENTVAVEGRQIGLGTAALDLSRFMDPRVDPGPYGVSRADTDRARTEVLEHLGTLPRVLLASVYGLDGRIVWSTNPGLVGSHSASNEELQEAFRSRRQVVRRHASNISQKEEQRFVVQPSAFFVENYLPLLDSRGRVGVVLEVYKEPEHLVSVVKRGQIVVWTTTLAGGVMIYLGLYSIVRRAATLLAQQQKQLVETESLVTVGEMATALAHSLRNPLGTVRSSAELALGTSDASVRKNAEDIIAQVDMLSASVRELLVYSRPLTAEPQPIDICPVLANVLDSFSRAFAKNGIRVLWNPEHRCPLVHGNVALMTQALHSVVSNAVEAMPGRGGEIRIDIQLVENPPRVELVVRDNGIGMTAKQLAMAFKPFHTTKPHGLGVGLPMLKRVMERFGGSVALSSVEDAGTAVRLHFRIAQGMA